MFKNLFILLLIILAIIQACGPETKTKIEDSARDTARYVVANFKGDR